MRINGHRFLVNHNPSRQEIHDLDNEHTGLSECQIKEIQDREYLPTTDDKTPDRYIDENSKYDGCKWCLKRLHRK